jgi:hypothetical protein
MNRTRRASLPVYARKVAHRARGLPRSFAELHRSLALLATMRSLGWHASARAGVPIGPAGEPLPFYNYAVLHWLAPLLRPSDVVFEFGSGNSTLWFARRVRHVHAVEHDPDWFECVRSRAPANVDIELHPLDSYPAAVRDRPPSRFDVVVIDGVERPACTLEAVDHLQPDGLLLFDNSDWASYAASLEFLMERGFQRIDFIGPIPGYGDLSCTSALFAEGGRWLTPPNFPSYVGGFVPESER